MSLADPARSRTAPPRRRAAVAALAAAALAVAACGPSLLAQQYAAYVEEVEPVLEQEADRWRRLGTLLEQRQDDLASPRYFGYLRSTALPFYTEMEETLAAVQPGGDRIAAVHAHLLRFARARLEFVHVEVSAEQVFAGAVGEGGLLDVYSGLQEAESLRYEYQAAVGTDVPDAKLGELYEIVDGFRRRYFEPLQQGAKDPDEVRLRLRSHTIRALEDLSRRKFDDDERGRLLKACVASWLAWHRKLERACPTLQRVWQIKGKSEAAALEAEEAFAEFRKGLEAIRRDR